MGFILMRFDLKWRPAALYFVEVGNSRGPIKGDWGAMIGALSLISFWAMASASLSLSPLKNRFHF